MRALGIDYGLRRIGLALSDPTGTIASPLETVVRRAGKRPPITKLEAIAREKDADHLVVGLPLSLDGSESPWCTEIRSVGERLAERLSLDISFVDERMTSVRAERAVRALGLPKRKREDKRRIDAAAAQLILQSWLDQRSESK